MATKLVDECNSALNIVLPFRKNEIEFLEQLQKNEKILAAIISSDNEFCERVNKHPLLNCRAQQLIK